MGGAVHILVLNCGSSSIKFSLFHAGEEEPRSLFEGEVSGIGTAKAGFRFRDADGRDLSGGASTVKAGSAVEAIGLVVGAVSREGMPAVDAVGYRVVHPGAKLDRHQRITDAVMRDLDEAVAFAPLHDPAAIEVIREVMGKFPAIAHYACFDTVFHETMPQAAATYAIPEEIRARGVRRYGFHGLSCESVARQMRAAGGVPRRMAIAHLGSGCSVTAVVEGRSVDTTMGLTPAGGVVMGTRPGDLDPGLVLYLLRQSREQGAGGSGCVDAVEQMLNRESGMVALSGLPNDMKAVREAAAQGDVRARLAVEVFVRSVRKVVGGFAWLMGGLDAIAFTGGIGENDAASRAEILAGLDGLGVVVNSAANSTTGEALRRIDASESKAAIFVVPAQEDRMIALHVERMARSGE